MASSEACNNLLFGFPMDPREKISAAYAGTVWDSRLLWETCYGLCRDVVWNVYMRTKTQ